MIKDYKWDSFWWLAIIGTKFYIEDSDQWKINWKYSKKKQMEYARKIYDNWVKKFHFILFRNGYIIIMYEKSKESYKPIKEWYYDSKGNNVTDTEDIPF